MVRPWSLDERNVAVGSLVRTDEPADWDVVEWPDGESVAVAAARLRIDRPPVYVAVPSSSQTPGFPVLRQLAQAVAAAVEAQRSYDEEHRIAVTLQRSLLQSRLPDVPGVELAVRYEPAGAQTEVGGDFYELTMLDGKLLVAIGDVAGHSLHAATVMAEVRHAVRAYAVEGHPAGRRDRAGQPLYADGPAERLGDIVSVHPGTRQRAGYGCRTSAITVAACSEWPATSPIATSSRPSSMVSS